MSKDVREGIARGIWTRWVRPGSIRLPAAKMRASIDVENVASDRRGVGQIHHGVRDVLDCRGATHRGQTFHDFLGFVPVKRRINNARRDGVDADAILRVLHRKMLGDRCKTAFRDHWDCGLYAADRVARQRGRDRDDAAASLLREHLFYGELGEVQKALKVRRYKRFEILDGVVRERLGEEDAGVIDQYVNDLEASYRCLDDLGGSCGLADVTVHQSDLSEAATSVEWVTVLELATRVIVESCG